jgi:acyl-CoA dehydrogenase
MRADWITVAVRTGEPGTGAGGISMLVVPGDAAGLSRTRLDKMGWLCSDTAQLRFDACACRRATWWARRAPASA